MASGFSRSVTLYSKLLDWRGTGALASARAIQLANAFATSIVVIWAYGLDSAGSLALSALPAALGTHIICFGLASALPRSAASQGGRALIGLVVSTLLAVAIVPFVWLYAALIAHSHQEAVAIGALAMGGAWLGQGNVLQVLYILQRRNSLAPMVPAIHLIGTGLAAMSPSFDGFALILLVTRVAGCLVGFVPLLFGPVSRDEVSSTLRDSAQFVPLDLIGLLAEQLPLVLLSGLLTRAELGLMGLLRQFVTVADTPGWSFVFNSYPALVDDALRRNGPAVARKNEQLAWIAAFGTFGVASFAASEVYNVPILIAALPFVLLPMPARYLNNFCEQTFRAAGFVKDCAILAALKIALSLVLYGILAFGCGFWGAVGASGLLSLTSGLLYRRRFLARFPGAFRSLRPWRMA